MELWVAVLGIVVVVLAGTLTGLAWSAWRRFEDSRFLLVGITFLTLCAVGFLSVLSEAFHVWEQAFAVEPGPLALLVVALATLYGAFFRRRRPTGAPNHG